jgi:hypothetical protein
MVFQRRLTTEERLRLRENESRSSAKAKRSSTTADLASVDETSEPTAKRAQTDRAELRFSEPAIPAAAAISAAYQPYKPYRRISGAEYYATYDQTFDEIDAGNDPPVNVAPPSAPIPAVRKSSAPTPPTGSLTTPGQRKYPIAPSKSEPYPGLSKATPNRPANIVVNGQS